MVASAWRASEPPSPSRQRESLPERQLPLGSVSKEPCRCLPVAAAGMGSPGPRPRGWAGAELPPCPAEPGSAGWGRSSLPWNNKQQSLVLPSAGKGWKGREEGGCLQGKCPARRAQPSPALEERQAASSLQVSRLPLRFAAIQPLLVFSACAWLLQSPGVLPTAPGVPVALGRAGTSLARGAKVKPSLSSLTAGGKTACPVPALGQRRCCLS